MIEIRPGAGRAIRSSAARLLALFFCCAAATAQDTATLNNEGSQLLQAGQAAAALEKFRLAADLDPGDAAVRFNLGLALFRLERYREALPALEQALGHLASAPNARFLRGLIFYQFGDYQQCVAELETVRHHAQFAEPALFRLVEAYRRSGSIDASQQAFAELNSRYPESPFVHQLMGMAYDSMHQPADAIREFEAALKANPNLPDAAFGAGYVHFKEGNLEEAAKWLNREIELDPCHASSLRYLGEISFRQSEYARAAERFQQSAECGGDEPETYLGWGAALERLEQIEEALKLYQKAAAMAPNSSDTQYRMGRALQSLGRIKEAQAAFERVKELRAKYSEQAARDMQTAKTKQQ